MKKGESEKKLAAALAKDGKSRITLNKNKIIVFVSLGSKKKLQGSKTTTRKSVKVKSRNKLYIEH